MLFLTIKYYIGEKYILSLYYSDCMHCKIMDYVYILLHDY